MKIVDRIVLSVLFIIRWMLSVQFKHEYSLINIESFDNNDILILQYLLFYINFSLLDKFGQLTL